MADIHRQVQPGARPPRRGHDRRRYPVRATALLGFGASAMLVAACGSSGSSTASPGANGTSAAAQSSAGANQIVSAHQLSGIGTVLVTSSGMTVYTPKTPTEVNGNIKCTGSCLSFWIPVSANSASAQSAGLPGKLSTITLADGKTQLTYNGLPLYTFRLDTAAGQASGNNFHDSFNGVNFTWQVVTTNGKPAGTGSQAPAPSYSYQSGY